MKAETWLDKSDWGEGLWQEEPDRVEWRDPVTGYVCLTLRHPHFGNWCGYVGLPPGHPWHGKESDFTEAAEIVAHGGLTFTGACMKDQRPLRERVCHLPEAGEADGLWWLGFDCGHSMDLMPGLRRSLGSLYDDGEVYRPLAYVQRCCTELCAEAARSGGTSGSFPVD